MATDSGNAATVDWRVFDDVRPLVEETRPHRTSLELEHEVIDAFQNDGVVLLPGAFTKWVEALRDGLDRILGDPGSYAFPRAKAPGEMNPGASSMPTATGNGFRSSSTSCCAPRRRRSRPS